MKIRILNRMHIVTAMVLSAAFLFSGCGTDKTEEISKEPNVIEDENSNDTDSVKDNGTGKEKQDIDLANEVNPIDQHEVLSDKADIYEHILSEYRDMVQNDFFMQLRDSDNYDSSFGEDIGLEIRTHKQDIYYTFFDIDGNGITELIIAGGENSGSNPDFSPWNYDLYGYDGANTVHIFPEMEFGYRTNFSLYENGVIEVFYSGSAAESGTDFYRIGNDGFTPELVDSFSAVSHLEEDKPVFTYYQNGNEIAEEEYKANIQSYEVALKSGLDWIQIQ